MMARENTAATKMGRKERARIRKIRLAEREFLILIIWAKSTCGSHHSGPVYSFDHLEKQNTMSNDV
jgi:hypothetical protein